MTAWKRRAKSAKLLQRSAPYGGREEALATVANGVNVNNVRREVKALNFWEGLKKGHHDLHVALRATPFSSIELLARWFKLDQSAAVEAAKKVAVGELNVKTLASAFRAAKTKKIPSRADRVRKIERSSSILISHLLAGKLTRVASPDFTGGPQIDWSFSLKCRGRDATESVAVLLVGPYRTPALYPKRRQDMLSRAMAAAWVFDHVVVLLASSDDLEGYRRWLSGALLAARIKKSGGNRTDQGSPVRPRVHVLALREVGT
jgi:hypothetical protein